MSVAAVVVAAGRGVRFGGLKQFATLDGQTVTARSVAAARSVAERVILVVPEDYIGDGEGADVIVVGGASRADSVRSGLRECAEDDIIVVHDAARPLASPALFSSVVRAVVDGADAAVPGLAITDTVKRIEHRDGVTLVRETIPRDELVTVQTPQAFRRASLAKAHERLGDATDDAGLVEAVGGRVVVVVGEPHNLKITEPEDLLRVAEHVEVGR